ncbi:DUF2310 family Zn-ribbon-containing protein [Enterococcus sp. BWR-S5]|uniref:DUF2310 family Zn-ribbon-containing protein n=1 Tax=Enterococcus sp. BWR-S5 TaxID=2787714 RepID=UPI0019208887|nr:DUF2310 family Zn-ribbon-containing protein [Enterococcus sp. BWR-S5]MBL1226134.1 DUF2310 family Zn-ribbon-containing protein [Enterococcus sp. BWR-S5]
MAYDIYEISFTLRQSICVSEEDENRIIPYLAMLYKNGLIAVNYQVYRTEKVVKAVVTASGSEIQEAKYENIYSRKERNELEKDFQIEWQKIGVSTDFESACQCKKSSWYLLKTDFSVEITPVVCGTCNGRVPLYQLPYINGEQEYYTVLGWKSAYEAMDRLFLHSLHDRYTYRQLHKPDSQLSIEGREIADAFEQAVGKPFYYYLFSYYRTTKQCPVCGNDWQAEKSVVDYQCSTCRLASDRTTYD